MGRRGGSWEVQSSAESLLTSVIKRLVRHTEVRVCSRKVIQGHSKARTEDHGWGKRGGTGEEDGFRKSFSPPLALNPTT